MDYYKSNPWNATHYDTNEECFILDANKEILKDAPGFDDSNWPNMAERKWEETIHTYYGTKPLFYYFANSRRIINMT